MGHQQQKRRALHEQRPDLRILLGSVAAGDENLGADAEPEAQHEDHQVEDTRQGRSPQFRLSDASQIGRIRQADQLLHQQADQHREGDFQDFLVRIAHWKRRFQCTKILFFRNRIYNGPFLEICRKIPPRVLSGTKYFIVLWCRFRPTDIF